MERRGNQSQCPICHTVYGKVYGSNDKFGGHCMTCHETFANDRTGDRHRVGDWNDSTRRCLSIEEMTAKGWRQVSLGWTMYKPIDRETLSRKTSGAVSVDTKPTRKRWMIPWP